MNNVKNLCQWQQFIGRWLPKRVEKCCQELAAAERFTVDTSWAQVEDTKFLGELRGSTSFPVSNVSSFYSKYFPRLGLYMIVSWYKHCMNIYIYIYLFIYLAACASFLASKIDVKTCGLISRRCSSMTSVWWGCERARVPLPWSSWIKQLGH